MKFNELALELSANPIPIVYFLVDENREVVYVGQTVNGWSRPYQHKDKDFDKIYVLPCPKKVVKIYENYYIYKYEPKYNKTIQDCSNYKIFNVREIVRNLKNDESIYIPDIRKMLNDLDINTYRDGDKEYVHVVDLVRLVESIEEVYDE